MREKEVKIKKEKAFSSNSSSSVAVQLTHGCVDLIEQGTICKERERVSSSFLVAFVLVGS